MSGARRLRILILLLTFCRCLRRRPCARTKRSGLSGARSRRVRRPRPITGAGCATTQRPGRASTRTPPLTGTRSPRSGARVRSSGERPGGHARRLVLTQPPVYGGPARPIDPSAPDKPPPLPRRQKYVPTIPEMLASAQKILPVHARSARARASSSAPMRGRSPPKAVPRDLAVRLYAFETGGSRHLRPAVRLVERAPGAKPLSAALGYNQLLITYTMHLIADQGDDFVRALHTKAAGLAATSARR